MMGAFKNIHDALSSPVLWKQCPTTKGKEGLNYHLYFRDKGHRSDGLIALSNLFPSHIHEPRPLPDVIHNHAYFTVKIDPELGKRLEEVFPQTHQIHEILERGGVRTSQTPTGKPAIKKLEAALNINVRGVA